MAMYRMPRLVEVPRQVELPTCMYKMESVNKVSSAHDLAHTYYGEVRAAVPQNGPNLRALESRQEAVLERLQNLKQQLDQLQGNRVSSTAPSHTLGAAAASSPTKKATVHDLVISANPSSPPYSLVLLRKLLKDVGSPVYSVNHLHSSVASVDEAVRQTFSEQPLGERSKHSLAFSLHWKDVTTPTLMVSPLRQTQVCGEANIVRYVSRLFPLTSPYNYEAQGTFTLISEVDQLLDQLTASLANGSSKERQAMLRQLNARLGQRKFLLGEQCGLVDVLAWSLLRQTQLARSSPPNLAKWYHTLTTMAGLEEAEAAESSRGGSSREAGKSRVAATAAAAGPATNHHHDRQSLQAFLRDLNIPYQVKDHEEVFTVEALMKNVKDLPGLHMKNLFLKDTKKNLYLLSARHDVEVKLNDVAKQIGVKGLRFADESVLYEALGVRQGCVTAYALLNDCSQRVTFLLDDAALTPTQPFLNFHPMSNAATLGMSPQDFNKFLQAVKHEPKMIKLN